MKIELIYARDCPNVNAARANLVRALSATRLPVRWTEWDRSLPETPSYVRGFGSPTVLVDGRDVGGISETEAAGACCRIYGSSKSSLTGAPSTDFITRALLHRQGYWARTLAILPGICVAMLPKLACPACWPAYAGLLSAVGLGFLISSRNLFWLALAFLVPAVGSLALHARDRRGFGPFLGGCLAAGLMLAGKFILESNVYMYAGLVLLVGASAWNSWPRQVAARADCPACGPGWRRKLKFLF